MIWRCIDYYTQFQPKIRFLLLFAESTAYLQTLVLVGKSPLKQYHIGVRIIQYKFMKGRKKPQKNELTNKQELTKSFFTSDSIKFDLDYQLFKRISPFVRNLDPQITVFKDIDSCTFKYIARYLEIRKQNPEIKTIQSPLPSTNIQVILDKSEVQLIEQIKSQGWGLFQKVLDASNYLGISYFTEMVLSSLAIQIIGKDKETLKSQLGIKDGDVCEGDQLKEEFRGLLKKIKK